MFEDIDLAFPFTIIKKQKLSVYFHDRKRSVHVNIYFLHMQNMDFKTTFLFFFFFFFFFCFLWWGGGGGMGVERERERERERGGGLSIL